MPHGQPGAELFGPRHQVELDGEPAMVALFCFFEAMQVLFELLVVRPRRAVDALQHRPRVIAAPVRAGHPLQREVAEPPRRGHVRAAAQIDERVAVAVIADRAVTRNLGRVGSVDPLDDLAFVRMVAEQLDALGCRRPRAARTADWPRMISRILRLDAHRGRPG